MVANNTESFLKKKKKATILPRKIKKQQYCRERYKNLPEDEKQKKKVN